MRVCFLIILNLQSVALLDAAVIKTKVNILPPITVPSSDRLFLPSFHLLCFPVYLFRLRPPSPPHSSPLRDRKQLTNRSHRRSSRSPWPAAAHANRDGSLAGNSAVEPRPPQCDGACGSATRKKYIISEGPRLSVVPYPPKSSQKESLPWWTHEKGPIYRHEKEAV